MQEAAAAPRTEAEHPRKEHIRRGAPGSSPLQPSAVIQTPSGRVWPSPSG